MYKFKSYMMAMLAVGSMAFLSSCGDDEEKPAPAIVLSGTNSDGGAINAGEPINITVTATNNGGAKLDKFEVRYSANDAPAITLPDYSETDIDDANFSYAFNRSASSNTKEAYTFIVTNKDGQASSKTVTFNITDPNAGSPISTFSAILMGAHDNATYGSFLDADEGVVLKQGEAGQAANQGKIDMIYYFGATNQATLAAPNDATFGPASNQINLGVHNWATKNETEFKKLTGGAGIYQNAATSAALEAAWTSDSLATPSTKALMLSQGNIVAFKTAQGKYGVARVGTITSGATGAIALEVKVQQ